MFSLISFPSELSHSAGNISDNESVASLSLSLSTSLPTRLRLPHDLLQEVLLLTISMEGSLRQFTRLCLVCKDWDTILNEEYAWATLARRFCPAFPLIHTVRFVPILVPDALMIGAAKADLRGSPTLVDGTGLRRRTDHRDTSHLRTQSDSLQYSQGSSAGSLPPSRSGTPAALSPPEAFGLRRRAGRLTVREPPAIARVNYSTPSPEGASRFMPQHIKRLIAQQWARRRRHILKSMKKAMAEGEAEAAALAAVPTKETLKAAVLGLLEYRQWLIQSKRVAQRRQFVLQAWMSAGLFFSSCSVGAGCCAAEGWSPVAYCNVEVAFSFIYLAYLCVFGVALSNVVMVIHFEPLALIPRVSRNTSLIAVSAVFLFAFILGAIVPTYLVQWKVESIFIRKAWEIQVAGDPAQWSEGPPKDPISWAGTVLTLFVAMAMWQVGVVGTVWGEITSWARRPRLHVRQLLFVIPHCTPSLLAGCALAFAWYLDTGTYWLLVVTCAPLGLIFAVLTLVFTLDAIHSWQQSDIVVAIALGNLVASCILLLSTNRPRGLHAAPVMVCAVSLCVGQMRSMMRLLDSLLWDPEIG